MTGGLGIAVIFVVILILKGMGNLSGVSAEVEEGRAIIRQQETADISVIEQRIQHLEKEERAALKETLSLQEIFAGVVVMGDSITEGLSHYGVLNASSVISKVGISLADTKEEIHKVKELNPQVVFFSYGLNDLLTYGEDTDGFIEKYEEILSQVQMELPNTKILVNSIFPVRQEKEQEDARYALIETYNTAIEAMCDRRQIAFVNSTSLVQEEYFEMDGIHFKSEFYPIWADYMAEVASL